MGLIAGLDEAGRGAWAGPLVAAAVILPVERSDLLDRLCGVRDSKQMTPLQRLWWVERIAEVACCVGIGESSPSEVDELGPLAATRLAMSRALDALPCSPDHLVIDHLTLPEIPIPQTPITHGDARVLSIAAASVVAKVARDQWMASLETFYPGYGLARHKGYGTAMHRSALERLGPCAIHRLSYAPVAAFASDSEARCGLNPQSHPADLGIQSALR